MRERGLGVQSLGVVASADEQLSGDMVSLDWRGAREHAARLIDPDSRTRMAEHQQRLPDSRDNCRALPETGAGRCFPLPSQLGSHAAGAKSSGMSLE